MKVELDSNPDLVACDHCGIVVANPREFGWHTWEEVDWTGIDVSQVSAAPADILPKIRRHHCPAAVQYNDMLAGGLIHGTDPNDAVVYEDWPDD